ncbi:hypothetical protein [Algoriphagus zhangzhouensis]|nr:hypothetical protein [Algoriphagus zhangzhouensis]
MRQLITIFSIVLTFTSCNGQEQQVEELKLSDFKFESIFGTTTSEPKSTYCLLGTGFFRTPRSDDSDSLITSWINEHPKAVVIPVSAFGPVEIKAPESKMKYCWIIDQQDTLNNYLIRKGCFPGGTMIKPKTWDEMEKWEKELYEDSDEKMNVQVFVDKADYDRFIEQIKTAELFAKEKELGIWKEKEIEEE